MKNPWQIYDELIDLIPADARVEDAFLGTRAFVRSTVGVGMAMIYHDGPELPLDERDVNGRPLRDAAALIKSWDYEAAAIGLAAINSALNTPERLGNALTEPSDSTFLVKEGAIKGAKVATIGHFGNTEQFIEAEDFIVIERDPKGTDLPDSACEYLLADRDLVFVTATTLVNKTMPRLLELTADAYVVMVGPSSPFAPEVFAGRVQEIAGAIIADPEHLRRMIAQGSSFTPSHESFRMYNHVLEGNETNE